MRPENSIFGNHVLTELLTVRAYYFLAIPGWTGTCVGHTPHTKSESHIVHLHHSVQIEYHQYFHAIMELNLDQRIDITYFASFLL